MTEAPPTVDGAYGVHPNIVDEARAIILAAIAKAIPKPDDSGYLTQLHEDVKEARPAQMDSWLAMDAVIAALKLTKNAEMAAFGASEAACYLYPGEDQQPERLAFCDGAAHSIAHLTRRAA